MAFAPATGASTSASATVDSTVKLSITRGIRFRVLSTVVALQLAVLALVIYSDLHMLLTSYQDELVADARSALPMVKTALAVPAATGDLAQLQSRLETISKSDMIGYIAVLDPDGNALAKAGQSRRLGLQGDLATPDVMRAVRGQPDAVVTEVMALDGGRTGRLEIEMVHSYLRDLLLRSAVQSLLIGAVGIGLCSLPLLFLLGRFLDRLRLLQEASREVSEGHENIAQLSETPDELGAVGAAFNQMQRTIGERMIEIEATRDVQSALHAALRTEHQKLNTLLGAVNFGVLFINAQDRVEYVNPAFLKMWNCVDRETFGISAPDLFRRSDSLVVSPKNYLTKVAHIAGTIQMDTALELTLLDGRLLQQKMLPIGGGTSDEEVSGTLWIFEDITRERHSAKQIDYLSSHDSLTGLANRGRLVDELERTVTLATQAGASFSLVLFDMDDLKLANEAMGFRAVDNLLIQMSATIDGSLRTDELFARLGDDEFALIIRRGGATEGLTVAQRILQTISTFSLEANQHRVPLTASAGVVGFPEHGTSASELLARARTAVVQAKTAGKRICRIYQADKDEVRAELAQIAWDKRIEQALAREGFVMHLQGVYWMRTGELSHCEALIRMRDPAHPGVLSYPNQFIPRAEKTGRILDIDRWVIRTTITMLSTYPKIPAIAINLSGRSTESPEVPGFIRRTLNEFKVHPSRLMIEITETVAVSDMTVSEQFVKAVQAIGCRLCLDDFGTGYSTFAYLRALRADVIKIDGSFVRDIKENYESEVFVMTTCVMASGLGKLTVAESVESYDHMQMLHGLGVDMVQGYLFGRPSVEMPALKVDTQPRKAAANA
jgi:diguanylate cyclase (GGDEF)-like protein